MPDIYHKFFIEASPAKVFEAFCSPEGLNNWWTLKASGQPTPHTTYNFYFSDVYDWLAEVVDVKINESLTWKMTKAMDDWLPTRVGFKLTANGKGTDVLFFHSGWKEASDHYAITNFCWGQLLNGLKNYVEKNQIVPFELRN